ncbi:MAG: hydrogenase small subunit [Coriobacteriia bacterium]|nr:hydrogenase small subunit [Coriobacteriia bacterium]
MAQKDLGFYDQLEARGVTRRDFLKFCGTMTAILGLSEGMAPAIASAVEGAAGSSLFPAVWMDGGLCTGCTESVAQVTKPDIATILLDILSLNYMETISMSQGEHAEEALHETATHNEGKFVLVYEGSVMTGLDGNLLRVAEKTSLESLKEIGSKAAAIIAVGSCAVDGGWVRSVPSVKADGYPQEPEAWATGVSQYLASQNINTPVINLPCCPVNPEWVVAMIIDAVMLGGIDADGKVTAAFASKLDEEGRPKSIYGQTIHDNCPRRGHFENGEFVYKFGSPEEAAGYCLYPVGCKGPQTKTNCPVVRWNDKASWCVESGAPCIGCGNFNWVDENAPFLGRFRNIGLGMKKPVNPAAAATVVGGVAVAALAAHGFGMKAAGRIGAGAPMEKMKDWDRKHGASKKGGDK